MFARLSFVAAVTLAACSSLTFAQANFAESFENVGDGSTGQGGPATLVQRGWTFRNQSQPSGSGMSPYWTEFSGWGQTGSALGHGSFATWQNSSSKVSAWMILPAVANQVAGDPFSVWTSGPSDAFGNNAATLEIRYSPSGSINTGSNSNDVGSFTTLLASASGTHAWTERLVTLPGSGRIAMRLVIGPGPSNQAFVGSMHIDSLRVGEQPPTPYPLPIAGQIVHWTAEHSPVQIQVSGTGEHPQIVAGGTVIVDPDVEIRVAAGAQLRVAGTMHLNGEEQSMVRLRGPGFIAVQPTGQLHATFADVQAFTDLLSGGKASFADSQFVDPTTPTGFSYDSAGDIGHRFFGGSLASARQILSLTRCTFAQGCSVTLLNGWLAARECTFQYGQVVTTNPGPAGGEAMYIVGNAILDDVDVSDAYIDLMQNHHQSRYIGNVSVTGNVNGPGIRLQGGGNYFIDSNVILQGNRWPVNFGQSSAGILPGSVLPTRGNQFNEIPDTDDPSPLDERVIWADAGIPYVTTLNQTSHGQVTILPGVTVKVGPNSGFFFDTDSHGVSQPAFLGEPGNPIRFVPQVPGSQWSGVGIGNVRYFGGRFDWCEFEGAKFGVSAVGMPLSLDNCVFRNNTVGVYTPNYVAVRKCLFENNIFSITGEDFAPNHTVVGLLNANHPTNPNTFINNNGTPGDEFAGTFLPSGGLIARAEHDSLNNADSDVRNNWWGTPTGPFHPTYNPSGTGDAVLFGPDFGGFLTPFLAAPPTSNPPPTVRFVTRPGVVVPGETVVFSWTAVDDGSITSQRVYYAPNGNADHMMQMIAEIPAGARGFAWTVPFIGTPANGADQFLRIVAVDDLGQEGIADLPFNISNPEFFTGSMSPSSAVPAHAVPGQQLDVCASSSGSVGSLYAAIELDNDDSSVALGGMFSSSGSNCTVLGGKMPDVSTDRARFRYDGTGTLNQIRSYYSPYFTIRPDALMGDAAPTVTLSGASAGPGASGANVQVSWSAADDVAIRGFDIRASFDGGTRWFLIAADLPASATSFTWPVVSESGVPSARIRVVAKDLRFQNSSAESGSFSIPAGSITTPGDTNDDGVVNVTDLLAVIGTWGACPPAPTLCPADFNGDGAVNVTDLLTVIANWG